MPGILDILNSDLGKTMINGTAQHAGQSEEKTSEVLSMAMPLLMQAMRNNAKHQNGAQGLMGALENDHDGSILDNLEDLFSGGVNEHVVNDGHKILGHILGSKKPGIESALSKKSGMDPAVIGQILQIAAPILLGMLGKEKRQQNVTSQSGLEGLLGGLLKGSSQQHEQSFLESILDSDGDGSIIDDVADIFLKGSK